MRFWIAGVGAAFAGVILLYLFATFLRQKSMFFPEHGDFDTSALPIKPEDVAFTTDDGIRLHGWLFEAEKRRTGSQPVRAGSHLVGAGWRARPTSPLMIWFHGNAGDITGRAPMAAELARRGISVLLFDYRGYGRSGGAPTETGLYHDAEAAYAFAEPLTRPQPALSEAEGATLSPLRGARDLDARPVVLYGESLGGPYAAYVAMGHRVRCVVIENSFPSLRALGNALYAPLPLGWFAPRAMATARWLNRAGVPVLVMHGRRDGTIPFNLGMQLYDDLRVPKTLFVSENAGHCEIPPVEGERYYDAVVRFIMR